MKAYENNLDMFGSVFRRSVKPQYEHAAFKLSKILVVGDADHLESLSAFISEYCDERQMFEYNSDFDWNEFETKVKNDKPDLILIQRQLGIINKGFKFSLGPILESTTQEFNIPVLVLPHEFQNLKFETIGIGFDHEIDNSRLINKALMMDKHLVNLELIHVEGEVIYNYYMDAIDKIPAINTAIAEENIKKTILDLSRDFFADVASKIENEKRKATIHCKFGETVKCYREIVESRKIDLLIFEAEDDTKMAMHSLGHSLTIQFPNVATLLV